MFDVYFFHFQKNELFNTIHRLKTEDKNKVLSLSRQYKSDINTSIGIDTIDIWM